MTLLAMSELVDDLQRLGIVERRPDPRDGRAKLICLTDAGWEAMRTARRSMPRSKPAMPPSSAPSALEPRPRRLTRCCTP